MKLLITGCAGFIGRHALKAAQARGWEVEGFDLRHESKIRRADVRLGRRIEADVVLHLAAFASNAGFAEHMAENYANNVMGTWNVLRLASANGARMVYASSSAVYGRNSRIDDRTCGWLTDNEDDGFAMDELASHYAKSKLMCEMMAESFRAIGLSTLGLRIFNAYGAGDELKPPGRQAPPTWMKAAKNRGEPMVIFGDGTQAKDFIHVSDVVEVIMRLIECKAEGIVNVGTGTATSFNDLAKLIGCEMTYAPVPNPESYQYFTRADTSRLLSLIGPYQFKSVEEGVNLL